MWVMEQQDAVWTHVSVVITAVVGDRVDRKVSPYTELSHVLTQKLARLVRPAHNSIQS